MTRTRIKRVYVAGAYSADNVIDVLRNMGRGMKLSLEVFRAGFSPYTPWFDYHFSLMGDESFPQLEDYYRYGKDWVEVSDAIILVHGWEQSKGTHAEIEKAKENGIPVFETLEELINATN